MKHAVPPALDIITCVGKAYQTVWAERRYILRLAALPFLLKIIFFSIAYSQVGPDNSLRLSLIMVPAWIVEGWMLAHFARLILLNQRWPFQPSGNREADLPLLQSRYRGVMGGAVAFALTQLIVGGWFAGLMFFVPVSLAVAPETVNVTPQAAFAACVLIGLGIYFFRFLWLYIAASVSAPIKPVAVRLSQGMMMSIRLLGLWLVCSVPAMVVVQVLVGLLLTLAGPDHAGDMVMVISIVAKVALDIVKNILCAAAVAYAFQGLFGKVIKA